MNLRVQLRRWAACAGVAVLAASVWLPASAEAADKKFKIFLSMSYIGNDWQAEAANMVKAMAAHKDFADKVDLQVQVAGPNAQRQIQQINAMVQQGAQAIVVYPISPTALNNAVKNACDKGVMIIAYDGAISEPCAYNVTIDQEEAGRVTAEWLAKKLNGKGNIIVMTGVPGTSVDTLRTKAAKEVFAKYPDIKIVGEAVGMWSQAVARTELSKILGDPQLGSDRRSLDAGRLLHRQHDADRSPVRSLTSSNPARAKGLTAAAYRCFLPAQRSKAPTAHICQWVRPGISYASPPYSGGYALKLAVEKLGGKDIPKLITLPLPIVTNDTVKYCKEGTWAEMKDGCNAFPPALVPNPGLVCVDLFAGDAGNRAAGGACRTAGAVIPERARRPVSRPPRVPFSPAS